MQYLANAFRAAPVVQPTGAELVERYCDRATNSTLIEDRRDAVLGLKGLAKDYKLDVGIKGMPILIDILNNDLRDVQITKAVLEALTILCTSEDEELNGKEENDLSIQFTEILIKDSKNVTTLLQALEGNDFYVRFFTIRLLDSLMKNKPTQLQNCILTSPMGVSRLIDLLEDKREIIRNEGLLLLISLSKSNAEIQKIIAFENTFEKLLGIIIQEGSTDGGIVVQDCLQLTHNLLRYNVSNQNLFRESSCLKVLPRLLVSKVLGPKNTLKEVSLIDSDTEWVEQKIVNTTLILGVIRILVVPNNPNTTLNQNVMTQCGIIDLLIELAFSQKIPNRVRSQALYAVADIIRGNSVNQDSFVKHVIQRNTERQNISPMSSPHRPRSQSKLDVYPPQPILLALVQIILNPSKNDEFMIRAAATYTFQCYVNNNPDGQLALLSTIMPPPDDNPNDDVIEKPQSPGTMILSSLLEWNTTRKDPYKTWFASVLLSHILMKNEQCKLMALKLNLYEYDEQISLLHKCMYSYITATKENVDVRVLIGFLCLIAIWLYDCPKAVNEFLKEDAHVSILIEEIIQSSEIDIAVQGLAAYLFGICFEFNDGSEPSFTREKIQPIILNRIGADLFISRFDRLKESEYIEKVSPYLQILSKETKELPNLFFDFTFVELFKSTYETISRSVIKPKKEDPDTIAFTICKNKVAELEKKVKSLKLEIEEKEEKHVSIIKDNENFQNMINNLNGNIQKQNEEIKQKNDKILELENKNIEENKKLNEKISELEKQIKEKDEKIKVYEQKNMQSQKTQKIEIENHSSHIGIIELTNKNNLLEKELEEQKKNYKLLEQEQDDLLVCLAEHDLEIKRLKRKLIQYGEDIVIEEEEDDDDSDDDENENDGKQEEEKEKEERKIMNENENEINSNMTPTQYQQSTTPAIISDENKNDTTATAQELNNEYSQYQTQNVENFQELIQNNMSSSIDNYSYPNTNQYSNEYVMNNNVSTAIINPTNIISPINYENNQINQTSSIISQEVVSQETYINNNETNNQEQSQQINSTTTYSNDKYIDENINYTTQNNTMGSYSYPPPPATTTAANSNIPESITTPYNDYTPSPPPTAMLNLQSPTAMLNLQSPNAMVNLQSPSQFQTQNLVNNTTTNENIQLKDNDQNNENNNNTVEVVDFMTSEINPTTTILSSQNENITTNIIDTTSSPSSTLNTNLPQQTTITTTASTTTAIPSSTLPPPPTYNPSLPQTSSSTTTTPPPPTFASGLPQMFNTSLPTTPTTPITPPSVNSNLSQTPPPPTFNSSIPPPPTNQMAQDIYSQSKFNNIPSSSRRHNRHLYNSYVPQMSFLPQTQFPNNTNNNS